MAFLTFPKGSDAQVGKHFQAHEFDCPCSHESCKTTTLDEELIARLDSVRDASGAPVFITSGNRCQSYQDQLTAEGFETALGISQHTLGKAADFKTGKHTGAQLETLARNAGFQAVGVGKWFIHADTRDDKVRRWTYSY